MLKLTDLDQELTMTVRVCISTLKELPAFLVMLCASGSLLAMQIPIGLDWRENIFIQEYWVHGKPSYCVANIKDKNITIKISRWVSFTEPSVPLTEWAHTAKQIRCFNAQQFVGERYLDFSVADGPRLGLLRGPVQPKSIENRSESSIKSVRGLNGSCRDLGIWIEHDALWIRGGKQAALTLLTSAHKGLIIFENGIETKHLNKIVPENAISTSLPIEVSKDRITIDTNDPSKEKTIHQVRLNFTAPFVKSPTIFQISAKVRISKQNQGCIVRGILVNETPR